MSARKLRTRHPTGSFLKPGDALNDASANRSFTERINNSPFFQFLLLFGFALLVFSPTLFHPYVDIDEVLWGEFANAVLRGCPPYVCVIGEKPPLLYLLYSGIFSLFGRNHYLAIHVFHLFWVSFSAWLLCRIPYSGSVEKSSKTFFLLPGFFYLLLFGLPELRTLAATGESFMNLFLILSWWLFLQALRSPSLARSFGVGFFVGLGSLFRHQAVMQAAAFGAYLVGTTAFGKKKERQLFSSLLPLIGMTAGIATVWALTYWLLVAWGSWDSFYQWGILHNFGYIRSGGRAPGVWLTTLENAGLFFGWTIVFWIFAVVGMKKDASQDSSPALAILILLFSCLAASAGFRFFTHYWIQSFPALSILSARGFQALEGNSRRKTRYRLACIGLMASLGAVLFQNARAENLLEADSTQDYATINRKVGSYLRDKTTAEDLIVVWGWGQGIYYYSNRGMGTRFIASDFLTGRIPGSQAALYTDEQLRRFAKPHAWEEFFEDLNKNRPVYFVDTSGAGMHDYQYFPPSRYPLLFQTLQKNYQEEATMDGVKLYRRK
ncbi:MAG: hypothetical protein U1F57_11780 [bacterium]